MEVSVTGSPGTPALPVGPRAWNEGLANLEGKHERGVLKSSRRTACGG